MAVIRGQAMLADVSDLPPAGAFRGRCLGPRELLARSGADVLSPPLHPKAWHGFKGRSRDKEAVWQRKMSYFMSFHDRKSVILDTFFLCPNSKGLVEIFDMPLGA